MNSLGYFDFQERFGWLFYIFRIKARILGIDFKYNWIRNMNWNYYRFYFRQKLDYVFKKVWWLWPFSAIVYICHENTKCELARKHTKLISENFKILLPCISCSIWNLFYLQNCTFNLNGYLPNSHSAGHVFYV